MALAARALTYAFSSLDVDENGPGRSPRRPAPFTMSDEGRDRMTPPSPTLYQANNTLLSGKVLSTTTYGLLTNITLRNPGGMQWPVLRQTLLNTTSHAHWGSVQSDRGPQHSRVTTPDYRPAMSYTLHSSVVCVVCKSTAADHCRRGSMLLNFADRLVSQRHPATPSEPLS